MEELRIRCIGGCMTRIHLCITPIRRCKKAREDLKKSIEIFVIREAVIRESVEVARSRLMYPDPEVMNWLDEANEVITIAMKLLQELETLQTEPFRIRNLCGKRRLEKVVYETINHFENLMKEGKFEQGVTLVISNSNLAGPSSRVSGDTIVGLNYLLQRVLDCIHIEKECKVIGLTGMGGVGKTTLLERVRVELSKQEGNMVIWVHVSNEPTLVSIQDKILGEIHVDPRYYEDESDKARKIYETLKEKTFFLLLDDVWERIDLGRVGIPLRADNGSKVILTTRIRVVCMEMEAEVIIEVKPLSEENAWALFRITIGGDILDSNKTIQQIALRLVQECSGLPLAIKAVGGSLKGINDVNIWKNALQQLSSPLDDNPYHNKFLSLLKLSYDSIVEPAKSCFLHCCLFPEDSQIDKDLLIEHWAGRGFLDKSQVKTTTFRDSGYSIIEHLVSRSFLLDNGNSVGLHDLIRDFGMYILHSAGESIVKTGAHLIQGLESLNWEKSETVSLMDCGIETLTNCIPLCPKLSTLILSNNKLYSIHPNVFKSFPNLTFLDLSWSGIEELPSEAIGKLFLLRYLNVSHTNLSHLPDSIYKLVNLEVFDLSYVIQLNVIPFGLWRCLTKLKILNVIRCGYENWTEEEANGLPMGSEMFLEELGQLSTLNDLALSVVGEAGFYKLQTTEKLIHCTRHLSIVQHDGIDSLALDSIQSMTNLNKLEIYKCDELVEIKHNQAAWGKEISNQPFFVNLHDVTIDGCWLLTELSWVCFVPNLKSLVIERCNNLKKIVGDDVIVEEIKPKAIAEIFARLENLYLGHLPDLESIIDTPLNFDMLKELTVIYCPKLRKLPLHAKSALSNLKTIKGYEKWWKELQWDDYLTYSAFIPYFKEMAD